MIVKNAKVFNSKGYFEKRDLIIENGSAEIIDATGLLAIPGLVDIHFHGAVGCDVCDASEEGLKKILDYELSRGVMAVCPTTMTYPEEKLNGIIDNVVKVAQNSGGADVIGINMEGPFISRGKVAAQNPKYVMNADAAMFMRLYERSGGLIKLVDTAPEVEGNMAFIEQVSDKVNVSLAHTLTDYETAKEAFGKGANHLTHMFNAMNGINHRNPGPIPAAREAGAYVELIGDGVHIHDAVIRMVFDLFDENKIVLISDSMMATGLEDGIYELGGQRVRADGNRCTLADNPDVIAGSKTDLFDCLRHVVLDVGVALEKAVKAATINAARSINADDQYGQLEKNGVDSVILTDERLNIKYLIKDGTVR